MIYEPFSNPRKIKTTFEKTQSNLSEIDNKSIKKLSVKFRSENHYKAVTIIPIVTDYEIQFSGDQIFVTLLDFPDWAINMSQPFATFHLDSAYQPQNEVENFIGANIGDFRIFRWEIFHWFTKKDGLYKFNFRFDVRADVATSLSDSGIVLSTSSLSIYANVSLYILNERNYNELQSGK